jgi:hypothetical protein
MRILVIAGNFSEATSWVMKECARRIAAGEQSVCMSQYSYINNSLMIRGLRDPSGVFVGTWRDRSDIREIVRNLHYACTIVNPALENIRKSLSL